MLRRRVAHHRHLLTGSAVLVVGAGVQALFGAVYWLIAARSDTAGDVGDATALFTSLLFVAYLSGLGLPVALARYATGRDDDSYAVTGWGVLAAGVASLVTSLAYLALVRTDATKALSSWQTVGGPVVFMVLAIGVTWSLLIDVRWMTLRRWDLVLARQSLLGLTRLPLLLLPIDSDRAVFLFVVAMTPAAISGYLGIAALRRVTGAGPRLRPLPTSARAAARFSLVNWLATLAYQGPQFALPVIVLTHVSSEENASFYVAWGITAIALYVPYGIGQALLAEGGKDGAWLRGQVRIALLLAGGLMTLAALATAVGRDIVTSVYGPDYAKAASVLPKLVAGTIPWAITSVYLTEARVRHRNLATVAITVTLTAVTLGLALALVDDHGLEGAANAFLVGNIAAAMVAIVCHLSLGRIDGPIAAESLEDVVVATPEAPA
jgi:O-antigen/teichoic acid export membrane protein